MSTPSASKPIRITGSLREVMVDHMHASRYDGGYDKLSDPIADVVFEGGASVCVVKCDENLPAVVVVNDPRQNVDPRADGEPGPRGDPAIRPGGERDAHPGMDYYSFPRENGPAVDRAEVVPSRPRRTLVRYGGMFVYQLHLHGGRPEMCVHYNEKKECVY